MNQHKIVSRIISYCLKFALFIVVFFSSEASSLKSQSIDSVFLDDTKTYRVLNMQKNSWLYWEVVGGEIRSENPTQSDNIVVQWNAEGLQSMSVYEQSDLGCIGEIAEIKVRVIKPDVEIKLDIPNIFTPNGDAENDYFNIGHNYPPENYSLKIFNRWGNIVFETHKIDDNWNGKNKGKCCNSGVYYYVIQYENKGKTETVKGFIQLMP